MIDAELQQSLRERFNPEGSMLRRQQLRMLEILLYVDRVCKEHNIRYWLSSGTLLGAVRHGGFIPWDDDLDIEMLREDYEKFVKVFPNNEDFVLQTLYTDPNYFKGFAKVRDLHSQISEFEIDRCYKYRGLFVDVFCLERLPRVVCRVYGGLYNLCGALNLKYGSKSLTRAMVKIFQKLILISVPIVRPIFRLMTKDLRHSYGSGFPKPRHVEDLFPLSHISFEGISFPAPKNIDNYLRVIYGDYMQLPNVDDIHPHVSKCEINKLSNCEN